MKEFGGKESDGAGGPLACIYLVVASLLMCLLHLSAFSIGPIQWGTAPLPKWSGSVKFNVESVISEPVYIPMEVAKMNRKISNVGAKNKKNNY